MKPRRWKIPTSGRAGWGYLVPTLSTSYKESPKSKNKNREYQKPPSVPGNLIVRIIILREVGYCIRLPPWGSGFISVPKERGTLKRREYWSSQNEVALFATACRKTQAYEHCRKHWQLGLWAVHASVGFPKASPSSPCLSKNHTKTDSRRVPLRQRHTIRHCRGWDTLEISVLNAFI